MEGEVMEAAPQVLTAGRNPKAILAEAKDRARALQDIVEAIPKDKKVMMNGEQYLELEHWQLVGKFYGCTAKIDWTRPIEVGGARGWEAKADLIDNNTGVVISSAEAMTLNDEEKWSTRAKYEWKDVLVYGKRVWVEATDEQKKTGKKGHYKSEKIKVGEVAVPQFQLRSMAQTRACSKVLRNGFAWVVVLAGYKPTPAEDLTGDEQQPETKKEPIPGPEKKEAAPAQSAPPAGQGDVRKISEKQANRFYAKWKSADKTPEQVAEYLKGKIGSDRGEDIPSSVYDECCAWADAK